MTVQPQGEASGPGPDLPNEAQLKDLACDLPDPDEFTEPSAIPALKAWLDKIDYDIKLLEDRTEPLERAFLAAALSAIVGGSVAAQTTGKQSSLWIGIGVGLVIFILVMIMTRKEASRLHQRRFDRLKYRQTLRSLESITDQPRTADSPREQELPPPPGPVGPPEGVGDTDVDTVEEAGPSDTPRLEGRGSDSA